MSESKINVQTVVIAVILSVCISVGAFTVMKDSFMGPAGEEGIQGVQGIQGIQGATGEQGIQGETGIRGLTGAKGEDFVLEGEWIWVNGWEWDYTNVDEDFERIVHIDTKIWKITYLIGSTYRSDQWFAVDIYKAPNYVNVTASIATKVNFGADELTMFGEGDYSLNMLFEGQDYVYIGVYEYGLPEGENTDSTS